MRKHKTSAKLSTAVLPPHTRQGAEGLESERRHGTEGLRGLFGSCSVGYLCLDENALVTMANPTLLRWTEISYESVIGKRRFGELLARQDRAAFENAFMSLRVQGSLWDFRADLERKQGGQYSGSRISDTGLSCGLSWETKSDERSEETKSA